MCTKNSSVESLIKRSPIRESSNIWFIGKGRIRERLKLICLIFYAYNLLDFTSIFNNIIFNKTYPFSWKMNLFTVESICCNASTRSVSWIGTLFVNSSVCENGRLEGIKWTVLIPKVIIIKNSFQAVLFIQMLQTKSNHILQIWKNFGSLIRVALFLLDCTFLCHWTDSSCVRILSPYTRTIVINWNGFHISQNGRFLNVHVCIVTLSE